MDAVLQKASGCYYTPDAVVRSLVRWAVRQESDRLLDPACGDGRFLVAHPNSVGVEQDPDACTIAQARAPASLVYEGDFFEWADQNHEGFDCAAGNPPFIRYQRFAGQTRQTAISLCARHGVSLSSLTSSWAPFIIVTATLLKPGGRMAFVVPAEIGHAPYAAPVLEFLASRFGFVQVVAVRRKIFPDLSEDCWLVFADNCGARTNTLTLSPLTSFEFMDVPPPGPVALTLAEWRSWNCRLRPFLLSRSVRDLYRQLADDQETVRLGDVAKVGIGYVTGANDFFHLRPSRAIRLGIPEKLLHPTVRNAKMLTDRVLTHWHVNAWRRNDDPVLLLRLKATGKVPTTVQHYLDSREGQEARRSYKCRSRDPWYVVPDVTVPDAFLSYMSGTGPSLVANHAGCAGTNSVHMVRLKPGAHLCDLQDLWDKPLTSLSCEIEGHPLGGGMLKVEPREASRILLSRRSLSVQGRRLFEQGIDTMRAWRHYG